jgi:hypothetical protein
MPGRSWTRSRSRASFRPMQRFRTMMLRAPAGDAPEGGAPASGQTPAAPPAAPPAAAAPAGAPAAPPATAQPAADPLADPRVQAELKRVRDEAAKKARDEAKAAADEEKRLEKLAVEDRAKEEARKANEAKTAAEKLAADRASEAAMLRAMNAKGMSPQDEDAEQMIAAAAKRLVDAGSTWDAALASVAQSKAYLFKQPVAPVPAAPVAGQPAPASPAAVHDARTLNAGGVQQPTNGGAAPVVEDANKMTHEQWQRERARVLGNAVH